MEYLSQLPQIFCHPTFTQAGLMIDILGALMIFIFGITKNVNKNGYDSASFSISSNTKKNICEYWIYTIFSKIGLGLVIIGFILQLIGTSVSSVN